MSVVERFEQMGVEALRVGRFTSKINTTCTLFRVGDTLIDTGPPNQWGVIRRFLDERHLRRVLLSHHHEDHGGNGAAIQARYGVPVMAHRAGIEFYTSGFHVHRYRQVVWGKPARFTPETLPEEDVLTENGHRFQAVHTPGHARDLVCFLEPERGWLFTGDLFITSKPRYLRTDEDPGEEIRSLERILSHSFTSLFCAHRGFVPDGAAALRAKLDYLLDLRDRIQTLRRQGHSNRRITRRLLGREDFLSWLSLGHFSKRNLVTALGR